MSKTKKTRAAAARDARRKAARAPMPTRSRLALLALVWIGLLLATAIASLCPRFTAYYAIYLAVTLGLAAGNLAFLDAIYRRKQSSSHSRNSWATAWFCTTRPRPCLASIGPMAAHRRGPRGLPFRSRHDMPGGRFGPFRRRGPSGRHAALGLIPDRKSRTKLAQEAILGETQEGLLHGVLEWVDALAFAAIPVILVNTFVFQLYVVPSESMVPAFLERTGPSREILGGAAHSPDRLAPALPASPPSRRHRDPGESPLSREPDVNLKKYLSQLVSMVTFTAVNIDNTFPTGPPRPIRSSSGSWVCPARSS